MKIKDDIEHVIDEISLTERHKSTRQKIGLLLSLVFQSNLFTVFAVINGHMLSDYWEDWVRHRFIALTGAAGNLNGAGT